MPILNTGHIWYPSPNAIGIATTTITLSATGDLGAAIISIPKTGNITGIKFTSSTVTTSATVRGTLQTVDGTTGAPTGTLYNANATGSVSVTTTSTAYTVTFAGNVSATAGDIVAIVMDVPSGTPNLQLRVTAPMITPGFPYAYRKQAGVATYGNFSPAVVLTYDTGDVALRHILPNANTSNKSLSTTTNPSEAGNKFTLPFSGQSDGFIFRSPSFPNTQPANITLYDANNNVLASRTLNTGTLTGPALNSHVIDIWPTPVNLLKGNVYRLVLTPTTTTTWTSAVQEVFSFIASPDGLSDAACQYTSRPNAGSWTDVASARAPFALSFSQIYQPGGSFF